MSKTPGCVLLLAFFLFFSHVPTTHAQFHFKAIDDDAGFEFQKPIEFYTNPRFNRVEGPFAHGGLSFRPEMLRGFSTYIEAGWGFSNETDKQFRFGVGVREDFGDFERLSIGADVFRSVRSKDNWLVGDVENSVFAFLFGEDYQDYYGVHGGRIYADKKFAGNHNIRLELERRTYDNLKRNIDWSLFGGGFQENPTIAILDSNLTEGDELGIRLIAALDWRDNPVFPINGWFFQGIYEHTADDFGTDGLFLMIKRFQQSWGNQRLLLRGLIGTRSGSLAPQNMMDLGGVGTLRGYDDKEFTGNRLLMLNANYLFSGDILQKIPLQNTPFFGSLWTALSLGLFFDTGWVGLADPDANFFGSFNAISFKSDVGLSLLMLDGVFRIDFARRLNSSPRKDDFRITFRLLEAL